MLLASAALTCSVAACSELKVRFQGDRSYAVIALTTPYPTAISTPGPDGSVRVGLRGYRCLPRAEAEQQLAQKNANDDGTVYTLVPC